MKRVRFVLSALGVALATPAHAQSVEDHYYWRPAEDDGRPRPWAVILPGGGGMEVFGDTEHYFRWAAWLNERGIDVLLVHYQAAGEYLADVQHETPGQSQARVVSHAIAHQRALGRMDTRCSGIVLGWSFGGEGTLELASRDQSGDGGLAGAIAFYPSVRSQPADYAGQIPVLVLQGTADNITTPEQLGQFVGSASSGLFDLAFHADAHHGFDVAGLVEPVSWNGGTFQYHPLAAQSAAERIDRQLLDWEIGYAKGCALD